MPDLNASRFDGNSSDEDSIHSDDTDPAMPRLVHRGRGLRDDDSSSSSDSSNDDESSNGSTGPPPLSKRPINQFEWSDSDDDDEDSLDSDSSTSVEIFWEDGVCPPQTEPYYFVCGPSTEGVNRANSCQFLRRNW